MYPNKDEWCRQAVVEWQPKIEQISQTPDLLHRKRLIQMLSDLASCWFLHGYTGVDQKAYLPDRYKGFRKFLGWSRDAILFSCLMYGIEQPKWLTNKDVMVEYVPNDRYTHRIAAILSLKEPKIEQEQEKPRDGLRGWVEDVF